MASPLLLSSLRLSDSPPIHVWAGELMVALKALDTTSEDDDVQWQLLHTFQLRKFQPPSNILKPHEEPDTDTNVVEVRDASAHDPSQRALPCTPRIHYRAPWRTPSARSRHRGTQTS